LAIADGFVILTLAVGSIIGFRNGEIGVMEEVGVIQGEIIKTFEPWRLTLEPWRLMIEP
jgi:hypothetical protein